MLKIKEVEQSDIFFVLDDPNVPILRTKPKRKIVTILAGIFGLLVGVFMSLFKNFYPKQYDLIIFWKNQ